MIWSNITAALVGARSAIVTGLVVAVVCAPVGYCHGVDVTTKRFEAARLAANAEVQAKATTAAEAEAAERVTDALADATLKTELTDAIADTPDTIPDAARVQLGCQRLRRQGTADADLPGACRAPGGE